jgi:hypothetical protein
MTGRRIRSTPLATRSATVTAICRCVLLSAKGLSGASEPTWAGLLNITEWFLPVSGSTTFSFVANNSNSVGDTILLSGFRNSLFFNNQTAVVTALVPNDPPIPNVANGGFTATVTPLAVGTEVPNAGTTNETGQGLTIGALTMDDNIQWSCLGPPPADPGIFEVEFEGSGVWDLYQALLVAAVPAAIGAVVCAIPVIGWIACLILSLIALAIAAIGALIAQTDSSPNITVSGSVIHPGQDVLFVMGRWVLDSAHTGWNELHPVISAQKLGTVMNANVVTGNPWIGTEFADPVKLKRKLNSMCDLTNEAASAITVSAQAQPQNQWKIHPLVDGCAPRSYGVNIQ